MDKNKYNPNTGELLQPGQSVQVGNTGTSVTEGQIGTQPITLDSLKANEKLITTPEPKAKLTETPFTLSGAMSPETEAEIQKIKAQKAGDVGGITNIMKDLGIAQGQEAQFATEAGADVAQKKYTEYANQLEAEKRAFDLAKREAQVTPGLTLSQQQARIGDLERQSLQKQADIAILGNAAKGDFDTAMAIAKRKVESITAPLKAELEAKKFIFENNKDLFSKAETAKIDSLIKQEDNRIAREEKKLTTIENIKLEAAKNGLTNFSGFDGVTTVDEALNAAGKYMTTPNTDIVKLDNGSTVVVDKRTGKIINNLGGAKASDSSGMPSEFSSVIKLTSALEGTVAGKEKIAADLTGYFKDGDFKSAYNQIVNTVENGLTGTTKTRFSDANIDAQVLKGLKEKIQEFEDAGGETGLLKGTAEQITRKLGSVKDPALASLAVALEREFQSYRQTMTGAAFSPKESREYASVNPKTTKSFNLNMAVIDGAISQLDNRVNSTVDKKVNGAGDIRKLAGIPEQNAKEVKDNPFLQVTQSVSNIYNDKSGWIIPGQTN